MTDRGEQLEGSFGVILRLVHGMREAGERFRLDPRMQRHLAKELGLTEKQRDLVVGLARRLSAVRGKHDRRRDHEKKLADTERRIHQAIEKGELSREEGRRKMEAARRELEVHGREREKREHDREHRQDERHDKYRAVEKEIRAAVEAGKISREDAHRKLEEMRRRILGPRPARNRLLG